MQAELDGIFTPVILGASLKAIKFATQLHIKYGVDCHIYDSHCPFLYRALPFIELHKIDYKKSDILLIDLAHTAQLYDSTLLYLFPMSPKYSTFAKDNRTALEDKFVIVDTSAKFAPNGVYK